MTERLRELNFEELKKLYAGRMQNDFPLAEIKPLELLEKQYKKGQCKAYELICGGEPKAYAVFQIPDEGGRVAFGLSCGDFVGKRKGLRKQDAFGNKNRFACRRGYA